jgi:hypothetical protein
LCLKMIVWKTVFYKVAIARVIVFVMVLMQWLLELEMVALMTYLHHHVS